MLLFVLLSNRMPLSERTIVHVVLRMTTLCKYNRLNLLKSSPSYSVLRSPSEKIRLIPIETTSGQAPHNMPCTVNDFKSTCRHATCVSRALNQCRRATPRLVLFPQVMVIGYMIGQSHCLLDVDLFRYTTVESLLLSLLC